MSAATTTTLRVRCTACGQEISLNWVGGTALGCPACSTEYPSIEGVTLLGLEEARPRGADYPDEVYALLAEAEPRHFWFVERNRLIVSTLRRTLGQLSGRTVLDVGCGTGFVMNALEREDMLACGLDMHLSGLIEARRLVRGPLLCQTATDIPFRDQFDVAILCDVLEHTPDDVAVLREAAASVHARGVVLVTVPAHAWLWSPLDTVSGHYRRYSRTSIIRLIARAGLGPAWVRYFNTLLLPAQILQRLLLRRLAVGDSERVFRASFAPPGRAVNPALGVAMRADIWLTRLPCTVGGSIIAIAWRD